VLKISGFPLRSAASTASRQNEVSLMFDPPNQVWAADITYIPMVRGSLYLGVVMDWYSRYVLAWRPSYPHW
jgi:transposase InsO family protein